VSQPLSTTEQNQRESVLLASYAMHSADTAGRRHPESGHQYRAPFQRDRDRVLHSGAYRRLSYKTQVFTGELGDYHRTRLTHTLEVASVARTMGRALRLNEDLIEALAMAHDLGHPPFGHAGEATLNSLLATEGGFDHNRQALRIVEHLEQRYPDFPGLNLSLEMLEGQEYRIRKDLGDRRPLLEVQVVDAADSVAYDTHDVDDALHVDLLDLDELAAVPLWREAVSRVHKHWTDLTRDELRRAVVHELIDWQVSELLERTTQRLASQRIGSVHDVRRVEILVQPGPEMREQKAELEQFLFHRVYRHPQVMRVRGQAQTWLREMFARYLAQPDLLPAEFQSLCQIQGVPRSVGDYLSAMTDRHAQQQHETLFGFVPGC
jgi:dGTPase